MTQESLNRFSIRLHKICVDFQTTKKEFARLQYYVDQRSWVEIFSQYAQNEGTDSRL